MEEIEKIESLDKLDKLKVYMDYYITHLGLNNNFQIIKVENKENWGDLAIEGKHFGKVKSREHKPLSFEEFISKENIQKRDNGEDWEKRGFAQKIWTEYYGIYDWFPKFENRIKL